jgi:hypothetical protein
MPAGSPLVERSASRGIISHADDAGGGGPEV